MTLEAAVGLGAAVAMVIFLFVLGRAEKQMDYNLRRRRAWSLDKAPLFVMRKR